jgi:serine/threonine-protein kinase
MTPTDEWPTRDRETLVHTSPAAPPPPPPPFRPEEPDSPLGRGMLLGLLVIAVAVLGALAGWLVTHRGSGGTTTTVVGTARATGVAGAAVQKVTVPQLVGLTRQQALIRLGRAGLKPKMELRPAGPHDGLVAAQRPVQAESVALGSPVVVLLDPSPVQEASTHPKPNPKPQPKAVTTTVTASTTTPQATAPQTTTGQTTPSQTTTARATTTAATPPAPANATMPDVIRRPEAAAVSALSQAGLLAQIVFVPTTDDLGTVEAQTKPAGTTLPARSHVEINLSGGNGKFPPESVPNVVGENVQDAVSTLNGAQLRLLYEKVRVPSSALDGKVVQQSPIPGDKAPQHAQVVVYVGTFTN